MIRIDNCHVFLDAAPPLAQSSQLRLPAFFTYLTLSSDMVNSRQYMRQIGLPYFQSFSCVKSNKVGVWWFCRDTIYECFNLERAFAGWQLAGTFTTGLLNA